MRVARRTGIGLLMTIGVACSLSPPATVVEDQAGSRVEAAGQAVEVGGDMRFRLRIPADARGVMPVRVIRPDRTVLVLRVEIAHDRRCRTHSMHSRRRCPVRLSFPDEREGIPHSKEPNR